MANLVAITGGIYSGKTTTAQYLRDNYGYTICQFSNKLKEYAAKSLQACGVPVGVYDIMNNKAKYRPFLQELGVLIGFDTDPKYINEAIDPHMWKVGKIVLDCPRTEEQASALRYLGFKIVKLCIPKAVQADRARELGVPAETLLAQMLHPVEQEIEKVDLTLDATCPIQYNASTIVKL